MGLGSTVPGARMQGEGRGSASRWVRRAAGVLCGRPSCRGQIIHQRRPARRQGYRSGTVGAAYVRRAMYFLPRSPQEISSWLLHVRSPRPDLWACFLLSRQLPSPTQPGSPNPVGRTPLGSPCRLTSLAAGLMFWPFFS